MLRVHSERTVNPNESATVLGELDQYLIAEGSHRTLWQKLGAHPARVEGVEGVAFALWAPHARRVSVVGDWNAWEGHAHPMRRITPSGLWELFIPDAKVGQRYKFELVDAHGEVILKLDPWAQRTELRPLSAGVIEGPSQHVWRDDEWMRARSKTPVLRAPMSIYEVHLGSWRRVPEEGDRWMTWRELAHALGAYAREMNFTHVELLPIAEHPFDGSWGYQVTGYFAPTARFGPPDDFRYFVDHLHALGLGVILDWVPAHFPRDAFALGRFDGTCLYEHEDPRQGEQPDWGTLVFNYGRHEVKNFLLANALFWLDEFHIDGLRVDAVASMLYLDFSRKPGEWVPNARGGRENLDAVLFLQQLNERVHADHPGAFVVAEESTSWPGVSRPVYTGGLGFTFKWNMGWMHDTLAYFALDPIYRRFHHAKLTFGLMYAFTENFVLPLSHDEVVHLKRSLVGKMWGDDWQRMAGLRALYGYMWAHPGRKLLFMGAEFAQEREWNHDQSLDWHLLGDSRHAGVCRLVADLNRVYRAEASLWQLDFAPDGFRWVDANDTEQSVAAFVRLNAPRDRAVLCVLNATPVVRRGYKLGVPFGGRWREVINTDAEVYGGSGVGNLGGTDAAREPWQGFENAVTLDLPPMAVLWLVGGREASA